MTPADFDDPVRAVRTAFAPSPPARLGVAVSGGSDSMALLLLLSEWAGQGGPAIAAVTVDHGLRPEAAAEAAMVAHRCAALGVPHATLRWSGWTGQGNLPAAARQARYGLIAGWARGAGIADVALGHTADDQAETVLMRLARGSGVDGLAGMAARRSADGINWHRPLLGQGRAALRAWLIVRGEGWADDPTNDDPAYDRIKARRALAALAELGLTPDGLIATAAHMRRARAVLDGAAAALAARAARIDGRDVILDRAAFAEAPVETRHRLFAHALMWVGGAPYRPRFAALTDAMTRAEAGRRITLHGCLILPRAATLRIVREPAAVAAKAAPANGIWDGAWRLEGPTPQGVEIRALGEAGLALCPGWRASRLPRPTLLSSPALWLGDRLLAAPLAGAGNGWVAICTRRSEDFSLSLFVH